METFKKNNKNRKNMDIVKLINFISNSNIEISIKKSLIKKAIDSILRFTDNERISIVYGNSIKILKNPIDVERLRIVRIMFTIEYFSEKKIDYVVVWKKEKENDYMGDAIDFIIKNKNIYKLSKFRYQICDDKWFVSSCHKDLSWRESELANWYF